MKKSGIKEEYVSHDFTAKDTWRIFRIMAEFLGTLRCLPPAAALFGSADVMPGSPIFDYIRIVATRAEVLQSIQESPTAIPTQGGVHGVSPIPTVDK
jgi:hypothetical protein